MCFVNNKERMLLCWLMVSLLIAIVDGDDAPCKGNYFCSEDCKILQKCLNGNRIVIRSCHDDSYFNTCNLIAKDCRDSDTQGACISTDEMQKPDNFTVICKHTSPMPHPKDCNKYFTCPDRKIKACPEGMSFNVETKQCDYLTNNNCNINNTIECYVQILGKVQPLAKDPNIMQLCVFHHNVFSIALIQCDAGTVYSTEEEKCIPAV